MLSLGVPIYCLLGFIRGLSKAFSSGLLPEKLHNVLSPEYGCPGTYLF